MNTLPWTRGPRLCGYFFERHIWEYSRKDGRIKASIWKRRNHRDDERRTIFDLRNLGTPQGRSTWENLEFEESENERKKWKLTVTGRFGGLYLYMGQPASHLDNFQKTKFDRLEHRIGWPTSTWAKILRIWFSRLEERKGRLVWQFSKHLKIRFKEWELWCQRYHSWEWTKSNTLQHVSYSYDHH